MDKVRFGVLGLGYIGARHAREIEAANSGEFTLAALADISDGLARRAAEKFDVPVFTSAEDLFASGLCDAVIVAVPHCWHPPLVVQAARAGLHVLCEKPLGVSVGPARAMIEQCRRNKVALGVIFQHRTRADMLLAKRLIDSGRIGRIWRISMVCTMYRTQAYYDQGAWRGTWDGEGGGVMVNQAPHPLDLFQWLGGMPSRVHAVAQTRLHDIEVENTVEAILEYPDQQMGHFYFTTAQAPGTERFIIIGDKGSICIEDGRLKLANLPMAMARHIRNCRFAGADDPAGKLPAEWIDQKLPKRRGGGHLDVVRAFARHVLRGEPMVASGEEAINELEISNAVYLSAFEHRPVDVPVDAARVERLLNRLQRQRSTGRGGDQRRKANAALRKVLAQGSRRSHG
jgi:predicted dehydrogenase